MPWREPLVRKVFTRYRHLLRNERPSPINYDPEHETLKRIRVHLKNWRYPALSPVMFFRQMVEEIEASLSGSDPSTWPDGEVMARNLYLQALCPAGTQLIQQVISLPMSRLERDVYLLDFIDHIHLCSGGRCLWSVNWARFIQLLQLIYEHIPGLYRATEQTELPERILNSLTSSDLDWFCRFLDDLRVLELVKSDA